MNNPSFLIRHAAWERDRDSLRRIREQVFVQEQRVPLELEWDSRDEGALHLLAETVDRQPIGTARMLPDGHIGRMAVVPEWRCRGVASALLRELVRIAGEQGCSRPYLNAQTHALDFYRRRGFVTEGPEFVDAGIPHRRMVLSP
jgi:predicted GNAT family N-acyltransferase